MTTPEKHTITARKNRFVETSLNILQNRVYSLLICIVLITIVMSIFYPRTFFSFYNFKTIFETLSLEGVLAVGMMFLIVSGVFDLSVGSNIAVAGAVAGAVLKTVTGMPIFLGVLLGIGASTLAGFVNGFLVSIVGVNALIATLAMMSMLRGIAKLLAARRIQLPPGVVALGQKTVFGVELPAYYLLIIVLIGAFLLAKTTYFRQLYYIGSNPKAAELSGIKAKRVLLINFIIMGLLAGFIGVVKAGKLTAAIATIGRGVELRVITAVIIGGGSLAGGKGSVIGAFMGALFMALIGNVMLMSGLPIDFHIIVNGVILLLAVTLDVTLQKRVHKD